MEERETHAGSPHENRGGARVDLTACMKVDMREDISPHLSKASKSLQMKNAIETGRCFADLQQLYQRTHRVLIAHQGRPDYVFIVRAVKLKKLEDRVIGLAAAPKPKPTVRVLR